MNVGIELGRVDGTSGTPYVDFHTDGNNSTDYNVRMLARNNQLEISANDGLKLNGINIEQKLRALCDIYLGANADSNGADSTFFTTKKSLFNGNQYSGTFTIADKITNYDLIMVLGGNDGHIKLNWNIIPVWMFKQYLLYDSTVTCMLWTNGSEHWAVKINALNSTTLTIGSENAVLKKIIGVKL